MASIRKSKKEIEFLTGEVISNCYLAIYFQPEEKRDEFIDIITKAAELHNDTIGRINNPQPGDGSLRKYYRELGREFAEKIDGLFKSISDACKTDKPKK